MAKIIVRCSSSMHMCMTQCINDSYAPSFFRLVICLFNCDVVCSKWVALCNVVDPGTEFVTLQTPFSQWQCATPVNLQETTKPWTDSVHHHLKHHESLKFSVCACVFHLLLMTRISYGALNWLSDKIWLRFWIISCKHASMWTVTVLRSVTPIIKLPSALVAYTLLPPLPPFSTQTPNPTYKQIRQW